MKKLQPPYITEAPCTPSGALVCHAAVLPYSKKYLTTTATNMMMDTNVAPAAVVNTCMPSSLHSSSPNNSHKDGLKDGLDSIVSLFLICLSVISFSGEVRPCRTPRSSVGNIALVSPASRQQRGQLEGGFWRLSSVRGRHVEGHV